MAKAKRGPCRADPASSRVHGVVTRDRILLGGFRQLVQGIAREAPYRPSVHWARSEGCVEINRWLVPVENRPLHASTVSFNRDCRTFGKQGFPNSLATLLG